jgi:hypothetical protein
VNFACHLAYGSAEFSDHNGFIRDANGQLDRVYDQKKRDTALLGSDCLGRREADEHSQTQIDNKENDPIQKDCSEPQPKSGIPHRSLELRAFRKFLQKGRLALHTYARVLMPDQIIGREHPTTLGARRSNVRLHGSRSLKCDNCSATGPGRGQMVLNCNKKQLTDTRQEGVHCRFMPILLFCGFCPLSSRI